MERYQILARRFRPQDFSEVIGQSHVVATLKNAITSGRIAQTFLFFGPRGIGKTSLARILAKSLNCEKGPTTTPCNQCKRCLEITNDRSLDVLEIDGASNTGVDEIRGLREAIRYMPVRSGYKIYIIDEIHMLSISAFNALLKTLEEPPPHVIFIFATTEPQKIPATIISRCQQFEFRRIPTKVIQDNLRNIVLKEEIAIEDSDLLRISRLAEGSLRDAQTLLDQLISYSGKEIKEKDLTEILGIPTKDLLIKARRGIIEKSPKICLEVAFAVNNKGVDIKRFYEGMVEEFRNLIVAKTFPDQDLLDNLSPEEMTSIIEDVEKITLEEGTEIFHILLDAEEGFRYSFSPQFVLESLLVRLSILPGQKSLALSQDITKDIETVISSEEESMVEIPDEVKIEDRKEHEFSKEELWKTLIEMTKKRMPPLISSIMEMGKILVLTDNRVEIGFPRGSFYLEKIKEGENEKIVKEICQEILGRDAAITLEPFEDRLTPSDNGNIEDKKKGSTERGDDYSYLVGEALRIFEGRILPKAKEI